MAVRLLEVTPVITAGAYAQNDSVGGVFSVAGPNTCTLMSIIIIDEADQGSSYQLWVFDAQPTGVADNAVFSLSDADVAKVVGVFAVDTWFDGINNQVLVEKNIGCPLFSESGNFYLMLKVTDATPPTFAAVDDLIVKLGVIQ
jgi:hypothetical protein